MHMLTWEAFSDEDRNETITRIKDVVSKNGGYIINFNLFSDLALSLTIEIEEDKVSDLHNAMCNILKVSDLKIKNRDKESKKERIILMNVSFIKGTGDLKTEIPSVPG